MDYCAKLLRLYTQGIHATEEYMTKLRRNSWHGELYTSVQMFL